MKSTQFSRYTLLLAASLLSVAALPVSVHAAEPRAAASDDNKVTPDGERIICRRVAETGSLVKKTRKCYTQQQWERIGEAARARGERLRSDSASGLATN